jgi:hypothetical protein
MIRGLGLRAAFSCHGTCGRVFHTFPIFFSTAGCSQLFYYGVTLLTLSKRVFRTEIMKYFAFYQPWTAVLAFITSSILSSVITTVSRCIMIGLKINANLLGLKQTAKSFRSNLARVQPDDEMYFIHMNSKSHINLGNIQKPH